jgi:(4S)-4-hydroxy-5-phosphonooxypentane-2,3-dione isomerase
MEKFAIVVSFTLKPSVRDEFLRLVRENAAQSVAMEPGCYRFDVMTAEESDDVLLYEIYADADAFNHHVETAHFKRFDAATSDLVIAKTVVRCAVSENAKADG